MLSALLQKIATAQPTWLPLTRRLIAVLAFFALFSLLSTCSPPVPVLQQIRANGTLRMATVNSATTYYLAANGPVGFEYDLARQWAKQLKVKLKVVVVDDRNQAIKAVQNGRADFAAGLGITPKRAQRVRFTQPYFEITHQVIYRTGRRKPKDFAAISGHLTMPAYVGSNERLRHTHPNLKFTIDKNANSEELLFRVANKELDYTIADSNLVKLNQRYYPSLRVGFDLGDTSHLAWAFPLQGGSSLYDTAAVFLADFKDSGTMKRIVDRYFGHITRIGFVGGKTFARQVEERLPTYRKDFQTVAKQLGIDWRLLAAVGYQESHWNNDAVSPTGVRGLMMLTNSTAREMKVDRLNPQQSISGGARYLKGLKERMPSMNGQLKEPDKTWMALAAYNIGMGHLMDARRLTQKSSGNPDRWIDVRAALPKLTQERYFSKTKYGYARGHEAVGYVGNIRAYYDILLWMTSDRDMQIPGTLTADKPIAAPEEKALSIDTPAL